MTSDTTHGKNRKDEPETIARNDKDLQNYATHAAISEQASAFLGQLTTTAGLYTTVTGAAWAVVAGNTFGIRHCILLLIIGLHIVFSVGMTLGMWGLANNLIQRLNFARWLGVIYWQEIEKLGGPKIAWRGVPAKDMKSPPKYIRSDAKIQNFDKSKRWFWLSLIVTFLICLIFFLEWLGQLQQRPWVIMIPIIIFFLVFSLGWLNHQLQYRAFGWPSLRCQRLWALLPAAGMTASVVLFVDVQGDGPPKKRLCDEAATVLGRSGLIQGDRVAFDQARYLFDKAGCDVMRIQVLREWQR